MKPFARGLLLCASLLSAGTASAEELPTFEIVARDGRLIPAVLEVPAGRKIKLLLRNDGPGPEEFENAELRLEKVLAPGGHSFLVVHPLRPGSYRFIGEFHPTTAACVLSAK
jgi:hypothetical protein